MHAATSKVTGPAEVTIPGHGVVRGVLLGDAQTGAPKAKRFTGVPYALPPTGERRWKKPSPLPDNFKYDDEGRTYTSLGDTCPQPSEMYEQPTDPRPPRPTGRTYSENCLLANIWVPADQPPAKGWPVLFYIHGGWLQIGNPAQSPDRDPSDLINEGGVRCIVVAAGYRLNIFGYLAHPALARENEDGSCGNYGFWDQRAALEWTAQIISHFGGDPTNITVSGLSAGAHSAHSQLLHEFSLSERLPTFRPLIRRVFMQSSAVCLPAKNIEEVQTQLGEICDLVGILSQLSDEDKIERLREVPAAQLVAAIPHMYLHTFRAVQDGSPNGFVDPEWIAAMQNGRFARWCRDRDIAFLLGEVAHEHTMYRLINRPTAPDFHSTLIRQVNNYYPKNATMGLIGAYKLPFEGSSNEAEAWADVFGSLASDSQVYASQRWLVTHLLGHEGGLSAANVLRYRIELRAPFLDHVSPPSMGVSHGYDDHLWWYAKMLHQEEHLPSYRAWLQPFALFVAGRPASEVATAWGSSSTDPLKSVRVLKPDGSIAREQDKLWEEKHHVVQAIEKITTDGPPMQHRYSFRLIYDLTCN